MLEKRLHRLRQGLPVGERSRSLATLRLGPAQVELIVQRAGLVVADRGVVQIPRGGARHVEDELPRYLPLDGWVGGRDVGGDALVELFRVEPLPIDRGEVDVATCQ